MGIIIPLCKNGDSSEKKNYRGVCLLAICSRVLAKVFAKRLTMVKHLEFEYLMSIRRVTRNGGLYRRRCVNDGENTCG